MDVESLEERRAPRFAKPGRPLRSIALAREHGHGVELLVEHGDLVRPGAVVACAAEAHPQRQLDNVELGHRNEAGRRGATARELGERFERAAKVRTDERPAQPPAVLRVDVPGRGDLAHDRHRLGARVALVSRDARADPGPASQGRVRVRAFPRERRQPQQLAGLAVDADDRRALDGKVVRRDGLGEHEDVALARALDHEARIGPAR